MLRVSSLTHSVGRHIPSSSFSHTTTTIVAAAAPSRHFSQAIRHPIRGGIATAARVALSSQCRISSSSVAWLSSSTVVIPLAASRHLSSGPPGKSENLQTSTSFVEGSRRAVYRYYRNKEGSASSNRASYCDVYVIPMAHAATREFYDDVLRFISRVSYDLRQADTAATAASAATAAAGTTAAGEAAASPATAKVLPPRVTTDTEPIPPGEDGTVEKQLPSMHLKIVLEGLCDDKVQREVEQSEWDLLAKRLQSEDPEDQDATTVFEHQVMQGKLFKPETQRDIAAMAQLPFPVPGGLELQEAYWVPLLASRFGSTLVNGDVCISQLEEEQPDGPWNKGPREFHEAREQSCVTMVRRLAARDDVWAIVVPWGHFHISRIVTSLLHSPPPSALAAPTDIQIAGGKPCWKVVAADAKARPYGWSLRLLKEVYNIEMPLFDNAVKHAASMPDEQPPTPAAGSASGSVHGEAPTQPTLSPASEAPAGQTVQPSPTSPSSTKP